MSRERVALITGSAGAIGAATAEELAKTCAVVVGFDMPGSDQTHTRDRCSRWGAEFIAVDVDIADERKVQEAFGFIEATKRLDIVVCCAGISPMPGGFALSTEEMMLDVWQQILDVNLTGTFLICRQAIPHLKQNGWGRIVTISSQTARLTVARAGSGYAASKAGVIAFTRVMALELGSSGVTANCVAPGLTDTRMAQGYDHAEYAKTVPLGRLGHPVDIAQAISFLASESAQFITGVTLDVNGGKFMA